MKKSVLLLAIGTFLATTVQAQEEVDLFELSLEDLMNVEIVSASKKSENLFDAPVSSYSVTREEIFKAGITSIPEALRLCPGVVVREMTNGNYDIHLRGFDNVTRYTIRGTQVNYQTLLMIDNRPVFNYTYGGIFWEALPVDIIDIERIEVVRGPSAPLFGPNAVTGVINIITRTPEKEGWYASGNAQYGSPNTQMGSLALGRKFNKATSVTASANYQQRERHDNLYYVFENDQYLENVNGIPSAASVYPRPASALSRVGVNAFVSHQINDHVELNLSAGLHEAEAQKNFLNSVTALGFNSNSSRYVNLAGQVYGVGAKISYTRGYDNFSYGETPSIAIEFDSDLIDLVLDYQWQVTDRLQLRPLLNFQRATYDDTPYIQKAVYGGLLNGSATVNDVAGSLRADYQITNAWRLIGSLRADRFTVPNDTYLSYQFASTYKVADRYLFRAAFAKSSSSAFVLTTSANLQIEQDLGFTGEGTGPVVRTMILGNPDMKLSSATMTEVGMRAKVGDNLHVDVEVFQQQLGDLGSFTLVEDTYQPTGLPDPYPPYVPANQVTKGENFPLTARQRGATVSLNFVPTPKVQVKPFVTLQQTKVQALPLAINTLPVDPSNPYNLYNGIEANHESTPKVYGGAFVHTIITSRLHANLNTYFYGAHQQFSQADIDPERNSGAGAISSKFILNTKVSYRLVDQFNVYVNVRNLLGNESREYYGSDRIGRSYYGGISYNF